MCVDRFSRIHRAQRVSQSAVHRVLRIRYGLRAVWVNRCWKRLRQGASALLAVAVLLGCTACTQQGMAVGDTQSKEPTVAHEGIQPTDMVVGVIGSSDTAADRLVLDSLASVRMQAPYVSTSEVNDPVEAAQQGVIDMTERMVGVIMISGIDVTDDVASDWAEALRAPREAGIPVVLLSPSKVPDDQTLYAATFTVDNHSEHAVPINTALANIINDKPHRRDMTVTTIVS